LGGLCGDGIVHGPDEHWYRRLLIPMFFCLGTAEIFAILFTTTIGLAYFLLWFFDVNKPSDNPFEDAIRSGVGGQMGMSRV
jgi:hypothetical protein